MKCNNCLVAVEAGTEVCPCCGDRVEKTADEMFSDLGYSGTQSGCYNSLNGEKSIRFFSMEEAPDSIPFVSIELNGKYEVCVSFDEISAIVQTIKEMKGMEEKDGGM